jgi:DNA polymerase IV
MTELAPKPGRRTGSARFATYYKVQWYDATSLCWLDIQKAAPDPGGRTGGVSGRQTVRSAADRAVDAIRDRFGWDAVGYGSVALGIFRSVPDAFRELAEKDL